MPRRPFVVNETDAREGAPPGGGRRPSGRYRPDHRVRAQDLAQAVSRRPRSRCRRGQCHGFRLFVRGREGRQCHGADLLAEDAALLALMREANFLNIFVGIESPDPETPVSTQKKQNTRRVLDDSVRKIYRAGIFVHAGFIVGFDSEKDGVAAGMTDFIEAAAIPVCMVGLLFALPHTQLGRRLEKEGRMLPQSYVEQLAELGAGDQCTAGLNFHTARPRREILLDFKKVLQGVYDLDAYYSRVRTVARTLNRPKLDRSRSTQFLQRTLGTSLHDLSLAFRILWRVTRRQPEALGHVCRAVFETAKHNREALPCVFTMAAFYLHLGPFSRYVVSLLDQRIAAISDDGPGIEQLSISPVRMPGGGLELALTLAHDLRA